MLQYTFNSFFSFSKDFKDRIQSTKGGNVKGVYSWNILVLNFEFLLVLNHDDVTWDCPKREDLGKSCGYFII
jgi:hypothetical protein